jgi:hypothetical protein
MSRGVILVGGVLVLVAAGALLWLAMSSDEPPAGEPAALLETADQAIGAPAFRADPPEPGAVQPLAPEGDDTIDGGTAPPAADLADPTALRRIGGVVTRLSDGSPLPGALVGVPEKPLIALARPLTDADGRFLLASVPASAEAIEILTSGPWPERRQIVPVEPDRTDLLDLEIVFDSGFVLTGVVRDAVGQAIPGSRVEIGERIAFEVDEQGAFRQPDVAPGVGAAELRVTASAPGHLRVTERLALPGDSTLPVHVELVLPAAGAIEGRLTDREGLPVAEMSVHVAFQMTDRHGSRAPRKLRATSDADGSYRVDHVPEGRYLLHVGDGAGLQPEGDPLGAAAIDTAEMARAAERSGLPGRPVGLWVPDVQVTAGETTRLDLTLPAGARVAGRVTDLSGLPVSGARVEMTALARWPARELQGQTVTRSDGAVISSRGVGDQPGETVLAVPAGSRTTDEQGHYVFERVSPGEKRLAVSDPAQRLAPAERSLVLQGDASLTGVDFALDPGLSLSGRFTDPEGRLLAGVRISVKPLDSDVFALTATAETDSEGRFTVGGLSAGLQRMTASKDGYGLLWEAVDPLDGEQRWVLQPSPVLHGVVTDAAGEQPLVHFEIEIAAEGTISSYQGSVYPEGRFEYDVGDDRPCSVTIRASGYRPQTVKNVIPSRTRDQPLLFRLEPEP